MISISGCLFKGIAKRDFFFSTYNLLIYHSQDLSLKDSSFERVFESVK